MAEENTEVAPQTAEENIGLVTLADVAEAAGVDSFIESTLTTEVETELDELDTEEEEVAEYSEIEPDPDPEPKSSDDSDGVKKRIGKLVDARTKAEEERDSLKAELEELQGKRQTYSTGDEDRFEGVRTFNEVDKREEDAEHLRDWLIENPDGGDYTDLVGNEHEVEYDQAKTLMVQTDKDLRKNIPNLRKKLELRGHNDSLALNTFTWMKDRESSQHKKMVQLLKENIELGKYFKKDPAGLLTMGFILNGLDSIEKKKQSTPVHAPKVPSAPSRATTKVVKKKVGNDRKALLEQARSGEVVDAASYIETLL